MKPPVVDDRSQFVEVIQKKSSGATSVSSTAAEEEEHNSNDGAAAAAAAASTPLSTSLTSLEQEMNKMWNTAVLAAAASATAAPMEPALLPEEHDPQQGLEKGTGDVGVSSDKSLAATTDNDEAKKADNSHVADLFSYFRPTPAAAPVPPAVDAREDNDEVLEEGLEAMWVEEIVSATPKEGAAVDAAAAATVEVPPPGSSSSDNINNKSNNTNTHTGRLRKSFFGKKKKGSVIDNHKVDTKNAVVVDPEDAAVLLSMMKNKVHESSSNNKNSSNKATKVQTSVRLLENEPELQLPSAAARLAAVPATTTTTNTPTTAAAVVAPATTLETPMSRKTIFSTGNNTNATSIDTNLLKEAALKAFTARKLLAQALAMEPASNTAAGANAKSNSNVGNRQALAQSAFREATFARKMVESGNAKGEGRLPHGLDAILRDATDKGAEAVAMVQKQLAACKAAEHDDKNNMDYDVVAPPRSIEEHADRARHYLDLILPDAPGMTQAQARVAAGAAPGDEVSSLGFDNTFSVVDDADGAGDPMNLLSMSSLNEILDGPVDGDSPLKNNKQKSSPANPGEDEKGGAAVAKANAPSASKKLNDIPPNICITADAPVAVPSSDSKNLAQPDKSAVVPNADSGDKNSKEAAHQQSVDAANNKDAVVPPDTGKSKKVGKKKKKKEPKSNNNPPKKSRFFGRFRSKQAPNLSNSSGSSDGIKASSTTETAGENKTTRKSRAKKAARDATRAKRLLASITIDDGQDDDEDEEPEELSKAHHRVRDVDDRMLKQLNDAIQADCDESVTTFDGIKMHGAPVLEVPKSVSHKKKPSKNGVEKLAPVVDEPAPKPARNFSSRQPTFISAPTGTPAVLTQASWDSLFPQKVVKQESTQDDSVPLPSSSEGTTNQSEEEAEPISSSSGSTSQRLDPPQLNEEQQALRNVVSKSPDSSMSHGDKYSVDQEDNMEQTFEEQDNGAMVENAQQDADRYLVMPADFNTFEAFLHSCGSEMDTLCGVAAKTDDATRQVLLQDLPCSTELPSAEYVVPPEGLHAERGLDEKKMTVETDPATLAQVCGDHKNNNRMKNILGRLSTKKSHELNTTKSLLSSKSSISKSGLGSSRKGILNFFNKASSKKELNPSKAANTDSGVGRELVASKQVTAEVPTKEAQLSSSVQSSSNEQEMDKQLSLPLSNELGTSSESTTNELPSMDKYSNVNDDGPKLTKAKAATEATHSATKSGTPVPDEKLSEPKLEARTKDAKEEEPSHRDKKSESKESALKKEAKAKQSVDEKRNPEKESKAKGLFLKPRRATPKKEAEERNKGQPKKESKEQLKKQKGETRNPKAKKQIPPLTKEEAKSKSPLVGQKKRGETTKESTDGTPFQNSSNKPTNATEQPLVASTSQIGPQVAPTETAGAVHTPEQLLPGEEEVVVVVECIPPSKKSKKKSKKTPVPVTEVPKSNSDTENKEDPLITLIREQSSRQSMKSRDPVSVDESDTPRGIDP